ncbi:hypothetical protein [Paracoccus sp. DMF]|uniref:hypothetical protein n=1 Tax=Paracoccus sp. DMF TaxID=400837 RepID=UPI00110431D7|nr:hypothetical protein [Paracoccus sp. DMF]MCV2448465.1 hypothetical protein [Paracoccus sp. DMF]
MIVKNLTNSPYPVATSDGDIIAPAFGSVECEPTAEFIATAAPEFWAFEDGQPKAKRKTASAKK